tara:strand:- start:33147 stop:34958 length:1812 start_codon:yes stop_codon:yes gene_type:complete
MLFRFPSISHLKNELSRVLFRFPLTSIIVVIATLTIMALIENRIAIEENNPVTDFLLVLALGLPLSVSFQLLAENKPSWLKIPNWSIPYLSLIPIFSFYFWRQTHNGSGEIIRFFQWFLYSHLLVAFAAFIKSARARAFWNFNYRLFTAFLISRFFGGFLFVGLILALKATSSLLEVTVHERSYFHLCALCLVGVSTFHFLALVPDENVELLDIQHSPPTLLKIFCQYILVPLNAVYILILYAYMIKILISGVWPQGMISWLVSAASILGVFALLLMNSFFHQAENHWMKKFQTVYYISIIPLLIMGLTSIGQRVHQYHLTEKRYILILLSLWLIGVAIYNLVSKTKNIILIPVSLFLLTFVTSFGPWGLYQVAWRSQSSRLANLLTKYNALKDGVMVKNENEFSNEDAYELRESLVYLISSHGTDEIPKLFNADDTKELEEISRKKQSYVVYQDVESFIQRKLKVPRQFNRNEYLPSITNNFYAEYRAEFIEPDLFYFLVDSYQTRIVTVPSSNKSYSVSVDRDHFNLVIREGNDDILVQDLTPIIKLMSEAKDNDRKVRFKIKNDFVEGTFLPSFLQAEGKDEAKATYTVSGILVFRLLKP